MESRSPKAFLTGRTRRTVTGLRDVTGIFPPWMGRLCEVSVLKLDIMVKKVAQVFVKDRRFFLAPADWADLSNRHWWSELFEVEHRGEAWTTTARGNGWNIVAKLTILGQFILKEGRLILSSMNCTCCFELLNNLNVINLTLCPSSTPSNRGISTSDCLSGNRNFNINSNAFAQFVGHCYLYQPWSIFPRSRWKVGFISL